ncbi:hypothetical protein Pelo_19397 [Pelomyxa schiedti]|nr:hypothetical protein Pelo_19397 [Pelomyxa schiedti]
MIYVFLYICHGFGHKQHKWFTVPSTGHFPSLPPLHFLETPNPGWHFGSRQQVLFQLGETCISSALNLAFSASGTTLSETPSPYFTYPGVIFEGNSVCTSSTLEFNCIKTKFTLRRCFT